MENLPQMEVRMEIKEYLSQSYRLNQRIESNLLEIERLKEMSLSVSAICYDREVVQTTRSTEAYFVKCLAKIDELRIEIDEEVKLMVELKKQIRDTIMNVENMDEKMVLVYRYIQNHTWEQIGEKLNADARTIRRWHGKAIKKVVLPENPIKI
ncbi:sigma factor-like helix-turn-helix DNA-binding protein [Streptococcus suis]